MDLDRGVKLGFGWLLALAACSDAKTGCDAVSADAPGTGAIATSPSPSSTPPSHSADPSSGGSHVLKCGWPVLDQTKTQVCDGATQYCLSTNGVIQTYGCVDHPACPGSSVITCECLALPKPSGKTCVDSPSGATVSQGNG